MVPFSPTSLRFLVTDVTHSSPQCFFLLLNIFLEIRVNIWTKVTYRQVVLIGMACYDAASVFSALFTSVFCPACVNYCPSSWLSHPGQKMSERGNWISWHWQWAEPKQVRGPQWWPLSHTDTECSLNPFLCHSPFTHANPLYSGPGINYFVSFRSGAFYLPARCAWTLSLWRTLMNVSGSEPLIWTPLDTRCTGFWLPPIHTRGLRHSPSSLSRSLLLRFSCTQRNTSYATDLDALSFLHTQTAETESFCSSVDVKRWSFSMFQIYADI